MTERARLALADAEYAWNRLEITENPTELRVFWFATIGLLRAVGHVLKKVDGADDRVLATAVKEAWRDWHDNRAQHSIFHQFIETERNVLLKEYAQRYEETVGPILARGQLFELDTLLFVPLSEGQFAGEDARDIAREAIAWWHIQLDAIDARAAKLRVRTG